MDHVSGDYSGRWGRPWLVLVWAACWTTLGFSCHYFDIGALPGKGYPLGSAVLFGLSLIAAVLLNTFLHRASALARLPVILVAIGANVRYPSSSFGDFQYLFRLGLGHAMLPRLAIGLLMSGIWSRLTTLNTWIVAAALYLCWDLSVAVVVGGQFTWPAVPSPNLDLLEQVLLLIAVLPPRGWAARHCSTAESRRIGVQVRALARGALVVIATLCVIRLGNMMKVHDVKHRVPRLQSADSIQAARSEIRRKTAEHKDALKREDGFAAYQATKRIKELQVLISPESTTEEE